MRSCDRCHKEAAYRDDDIKAVRMDLIDVEAEDDIIDETEIIDLCKGCLKEVIDTVKPLFVMRPRQPLASPE